ncbi:MAG: lysophospholipid acyltransferase family protein [Acidobacteriota bacterium]
MNEEILSLFDENQWADSGAVAPAWQVFVDRWIRRGLIAGLGLGFTLPYFRLLNRIRVRGHSILDQLPRKNVIFLSNHQTYFLDAIAFFDLVYVRKGYPLEDPFLRFSAAEETIKRSLLTSIMSKAGGVTVKRSFREGGRDVKRSVDLEGAERVAQAIACGWLLHFPSGTTQRGAPLRPGVAMLLHRTRAVAVPLRVDGFRDLLLHKQIPGRLWKKCSITIHQPLDLQDFYARPYTKEAGQEVLRRLTELIGDKDAGAPAAGAPMVQAAGLEEDK